METTEMIANNFCYPKDRLRKFCHTEHPFPSNLKTALTLGSVQSLATVKSKELYFTADKRSI